MHLLEKHHPLNVKNYWNALSRNSSGRTQRMDDSPHAAYPKP